MTKYWFVKIVNDINYILFPRVCFGCNTQLFRGEYLLCTVCRNDLPITEYNFQENNEIDRIFYGRIPVVKASTFLFFSQNGIVKQLLHHLKYKNQEVIGDYFGNWYGELLKKQCDLKEIDIIIPVPLHPNKLKKRGYNQVEKFGKQIAKHIDAVFLKDALVKTADTKTLTQKNRFNRWQSTKELYVITNSTILENKNILLIDDVITTGATIEACGSALLKAKGTLLYVLSLAFVPEY